MLLLIVLQRFPRFDKFYVTYICSFQKLQSCLALSANPVLHSRIKHMETDFHFFREKVQNKDLIVQYVPTDEQVADILIKGLHSPIFVKHCSNLSLGSPPAAIKAGC
ncbi:hypothetical protein CerSpe_111400 [Prunus speciosa]